MPRIPRVDVGDEVYHIINRANARLPIFFHERDYQLFELILAAARERFDMRILAYCLMPNHFHFVLYPHKDGDLQKFMQWITLTHTQRWHSQNKTIGTGHLYQGRYKSFLIQSNDHLLSVIRYVEGNPLRANLVKKAENWDFSSLSKRIFNHDLKEKILSQWPIVEPVDYLNFVNTSMGNDEQEKIRYCLNRGKPFGSDDWTSRMIGKYGLMATVRNRGRQQVNI